MCTKLDELHFALMLVSQTVFYKELSISVARLWINDPQAVLWLISLLQGIGSSSLAVWTWSRLTTPLWCFLTLCLLDYWLPLPFAFSLFTATSFSSCSLNASLPSCLCFLSHSPSFIPTIFFCFSHAVLFPSLFPTSLLLFPLGLFLHH